MRSTDNEPLVPLTLPPQDQQALDALLDALEAQHGHSVLGVLVYGSCLRSGDIFDGLVDLYLLCSSYREAYGSTRLALSNKLLPPNVFYAQQHCGDRILRSKVNLVSLADFRRGCSSRRFESYFWGRFAQPVALPRVRDTRARAAILDALRSASRTLLQRTLPMLPAEGSVDDLWVDALQLSYATELRTERPGRTRELVSSAGGFYRDALAAAAADPSMRLTLDTSVSPARYVCEVSSSRRLRAQVAWAARKVTGKLLSITRLVKALFTFGDGLDYIAWKLERHSGEHIQIPPRVRRWPLLYCWGFFWRLYRRGIFR